MNEAEKIVELGHYDTTINIIGGLRDCTLIYQAIDSFIHDDSLCDVEPIQNKLNLRTERSRTRVGRAIKEGFLGVYNQEHRDLVQSFFQSKVSFQEKELVLFWQFALNNRLFREISLNVFLKIYFSGRTTISKEDIIAYLKEFLNQHKELNLNWSESTINTLSTKYLNFMSKLNFLEGARIKSFKDIKPTSEMLVIFLYFAKLYDPENSDILKNQILPFSFILPEDIPERLKKLSMKGFFHMNYNGVSLNIELTNTYQGICDALYN